jgi:hypothetical protein
VGSVGSIAYATDKGCGAIEDQRYVSSW